MSDASVDKNRDHFDMLYRKADVSKIVETVRRHSSFLEQASTTEINWAGLYRDGFQDRLQGAKVLELGAGSGLNALIMASLGADVLAIDVASESPRIIDQASRELGLSGRVEAVAEDFLALPFTPGSFDYVVGQAFLHHLTHELEDRYLRKIATVLRDTGEARFFEPAVNSKLLDTMRWLVPVPGRPSRLSRKAFAAWKAWDAHPDRDNSSLHFEEVGRRYFHQVETVPMGGVERFYRILPLGRFERPFRRWALRVDGVLPHKLRLAIARSQSIVMRGPRRLGSGEEQ